MQTSGANIEHKRSEIECLWTLNERVRQKTPSVLVANKFIDLHYLLGVD